MLAEKQLGNVITSAEAELFFTRALNFAKENAVKSEKYPSIQKLSVRKEAKIDKLDFKLFHSVLSQIASKLFPSSPAPLIELYKNVRDDYHPVECEQIGETRRRHRRVQKTFR